MYTLHFRILGKYLNKTVNSTLKKLSVYPQFIILDTNTQKLDVS